MEAIWKKNKKTKKKLALDLQENFKVIKSKNHDKFGDQIYIFSNLNAGCKKIASRSIKCDHWKGPGKLLLHLTNL